VTPRLSRRALLASGAGVLAGAAAVGTAVFRHDRSTVSPKTTTQRPNPGGQVRAISAVGAAYVAHGGEPKPVPGFEVSGGDEVLAQFGELDRRVRADFSHGRTVLVGGWLLARTEADAAGLLALELSGHGAR